MVTGVRKGALAGTCKERVRYGWGRKEEQRDSVEVTCSQSCGLVKPVEKDAEILSIGFKSFPLPKLHCGCSTGNGLVGNRKGKVERQEVGGLLQQPGWQVRHSQHASTVLRTD